MTRYFRAAAAALVLTGGLGSVGCAHKAATNGCGANGAGSGNAGRWIDPSWPDRYTYAARQAVIAPFAQQVANGHFTNQTLWNWYFEPGTDKLNGAGMEKLDSIARTTPNPDTKLFLQAARDLGVTPENMDKVVALRDELTARRAAAIHRYMATQPGPTVLYDVSVVDMPTPGIYAPFAAQSFRGQLRGYTGGVSGGGGGGTAGISGGTGLQTTAPQGSAGAGAGGTGGTGTGAPPY
jgi:hypothetical protein